MLTMFESLKEVDLNTPEDDTRWFTVTYKSVKAISDILYDAGVAHVFWGWNLQDILGVPVGQAVGSRNVSKSLKLIEAVYGVCGGR
jgi:hypothetical protein